ncbi:MFS transporter [bacterium]|nr:MFS transporter [bacterium]
MSSMQQHPMKVVLKNPNLRLLWIGEGFSVLGSQFYMIALPWLVLQLTGDPFQMGSVLALAGIPRALFMLIGGALTDRFSPKTLMICSNLVRMSVGICLTVLVLNGWVSIIFLYLLSLTFGLADAFLYPAQSAILPRIVESEHLLAGNSIVQGTAQLSIAAGPALAGTIIAIFSSSPASGVDTKEAMDLFGISIAFSVNALSFFLSILAFAFIRYKTDKVDKKDEPTASVTSLLKEGMAYVISDKTLVYLLLVAAVSHFLVEGPLFIGIPVLAHTKFTEGAAAFGIIMSGLGAGMLIGIIGAGTLPKLKPERMGQTLMILLSLSGFGLMTVGFMSNTYMTAFVVMLMGIAQGYVIVQFSTWMQIRTPQHLLGRVLSMMMFASVGLVPISQALCGALIKLSIPGLFIGAGIILTIINMIVTFRPEIKNMGLVVKNSDKKN